MTSIRLRWSVSLLLVVGIWSCGSGTPTAPENAPAPVILPLGSSYLLFLTEGGFSQGCSAPTNNGSKLAPFATTLMTLTWSGSEWVASATHSGGGDVEMRFRESGAADQTGTVSVTGTMKGTAIHEPQYLGGFSAYAAQMTFGAGSTFSGTITPPRTGLNFHSFPITQGNGTGAVTLREAGVVCGGTSFQLQFWSDSTASLR